MRGRGTCNVQLRLRSEAGASAFSALWQWIVAPRRLSLSRAPSCSSMMKGSRCTRAGLRRPALFPGPTPAVVYPVSGDIDSVERRQVEALRCFAAVHYRIHLQRAGRASRHSRSPNRETIFEPGLRDGRSTQVAQTRVLSPEQPVDGGGAHSQELLTHFCPNGQIT